MLSIKWYNNSASHLQGGYFRGLLEQNAVGHCRYDPAKRFRGGCAPFADGGSSAGGKGAVARTAEFP